MKLLVTDRTCNCGQCGFPHNIILLCIFKFQAAHRPINLMVLLIKKNKWQPYGFIVVYTTGNYLNNKTCAHIIK